MKRRIGCQGIDPGQEGQREAGLSVADPGELTRTRGSCGARLVIKSN